MKALIVKIFIILSILVSLCANELIKSKKRMNIGMGRNENGVFGVGDKKNKAGEVLTVGYGNVFGDVKTPYRALWSCGQRTFLQDGNMDIYGFGSDHACEIGFGDIPNENTFFVPKKLDFLNNVDTEIVDIDGIGDHTIALGANGKVWSWGFNGDGCLGKSKDIYETCTPQLIFPQDEDDNRIAIDMSSGVCHSLVLVQDRTTHKTDVLGAGCNELTELGISTNSKNSYYTLTQIDDLGSLAVKNASAGAHFSIFLSVEGVVYYSGHILCEDSTDSFYRKSIVEIYRNDSFPVFDIHAGFTHMVFTHQDGSMLGFGCNDGGVLGKVSVGFHDKVVPLNVSMIENAGETINGAICGDAAIAVLTNEGGVWFIGRKGRSPFSLETHGEFVKLQAGDEKIIAIGSPGDHFPAISEDKIFCNGENTFFQCGMVPQTHFVYYQDYNSKAFLHTDIVLIEVSGEHTFGVDSLGKVHVMGANSQGQLGIGSFKDFLVPVQMDLLNESFIVGGNVNLESSVFLSDVGEVYTVGNGEYGCLGSGNFLLRNVPTKIGKDKFGNKRVKRVISQHKHVHALTEDGKLYSWGFGGYGNLGFGNKTQLVIVPTKHDEIEDEIILVAVGFRFVIAVTKMNEVYRWGTLIFYESNLPQKETVTLWRPTLLENPRWEGKRGWADGLGGQGMNGKVCLLEAGNSMVVVGVDYGKGNNFVLYWWGLLGDDDNPPKTIVKDSDPQIFYSSKTRLKRCFCQRHCICIDELGQVYGVGSNDYQQLSPLMKKPYYHNFTRIPMEQIANETFIYGFSRATISDYSTILQEYVKCFGKLDSEVDVCSGNGVCVGNNTCRCNPGYRGNNCDKYSCSLNGTILDCHGHGNCVGPLICTCGTGWANYDQKKIHLGMQSKYGFCGYPVCPSTSSQKICSGNGNCSILLVGTEKVPTCECSNDYRSDSCDLPVCNNEHGMEQKPDGCKAYSECASVGHCVCDLTGLNYLLPLSQGGYSEGCTFSFVKMFVYILVLIAVCCVLYCCVWCCAGYVCCLVRKERKKSKEVLKQLTSKKQEEKHLQEFYEYSSPYEELKDIRGDNQENEEDNEEETIKNRKASETTVLLSHEGVSVETRRRKIQLGKNHLFEGDLDGKGRIYYLKFDREEHHKKRTRREKRSIRRKGGKYRKEKLYVVFAGNFKNGKKEGYGVEYRVHFHEHPVETGFLESENNYRFAGNFSKDMRHGKGTEFDENGTPIRVGEYVEGMLMRVLSIDYPLRVFDLNKDIFYEKGNEEILGSGGFAKIIAGRIKEADGTIIECAVKFFRDIFEIKEFEGGNESISWELAGNLYQEKIRDLEYRRLQNSVSDILKILSMFPHPHIIQILGWSNYNSDINRFGYVMEKCVESVSQRYDRMDRRMTMSEKTQLLYETALGVSHIHSIMGLIHRDLKWGNCLIDNMDHIKICDFDMSDRDEMDFSGRKNSSRIQGSVFHVAPEILKTSTFGKSCDVYSFGIMMYELLFNRMNDPFGVFDSEMCHICGEEFQIRDFSSNNDNSGPNSRSGRQMYIIKFMRKHYEKCCIRPKLENYRLIQENNRKEEEEEENEGESSDEEEEEVPKVQNDDIVEVYPWQILLMKRCWNDDPEKRPTFKEISEQFVSRKKRKNKKLRRTDSRREIVYSSGSSSQYHSINSSAKYSD